jgi:hypothetical protein
MIVIYDHNTNGLYYKTMIVTNLTTIVANLTTIVTNLTMIIANLALAWNVNYYGKVCCKLKLTFTIVNYDPKPFTVQATGQLGGRHDYR